MNNSKKRAIIFFVIMIVFVTASLLKLDSIWDICVLLGLGWLFFTGLADDIVKRISGTTEQHDDKKKLVSFNDTIADELMRIRSDLM